MPRRCWPTCAAIGSKNAAQRRGINPYDDIELTAITIREGAVDRAIPERKGGRAGPLLMMVSTEEEHHFANSGTTLPDYWNEAQRCIKKCHDAGMKMCGTVSTIWGSPIGGATELKDAVEFTKRWLEIGADDIEHADHDGSASAPEVYRYFSMILDEIPDTRLHIAHFHETKRVAAASVLAALQAGITHFEATLGGMGGQPANFLDDCPGARYRRILLRRPALCGVTCWKTCWCRSTRWASSTATTWIACSGWGGSWNGPWAIAALRSGHQRPHPEGGHMKFARPGNARRAWVRRLTSIFRPSGRKRPSCRRNTGPRSTP
jgi:hypothetical protein